MPAQILLLAQLVVGMLATGRRVPDPRKAWPNLLRAIQCVLCAGFGLFLAAMLIFAMPTASPAARLLSPLAVIAGLVPFLVHFARLRQWMLVQSIAYTTLSFLLFNIFHTAKDNLRSPMAAGARAAALLAESPHALASLPEAVSFYMPLDLPQDPAAPRAMAILSRRSRQPKPEAVAAIFSSEFPGSSIAAVEPIAVPSQPSASPWHLYRLTLVPKASAP